MIQLEPARRIRVYNSKDPAVVYEGQAIAVAYYQGNEEQESAFSLLVVVDIPGATAPQMREVVVPYMPGTTFDVTPWRIEDHGTIHEIAIDLADAVKAP